jgi:uncharacterized LabA/DUF88 family protein
MKKDYVLIDGENFVHKLVENLKKQKLAASRFSIGGIDIEQLFDFARGANVNYYTTAIRVPASSQSYKKVARIIKWNSRWIPSLKFQGVNIIKAGFLRVRDGKKCAKCGAKTEVLMEKGVDVGLAVDIVVLAEKGSKIFVVSSDTDLIPAIKRARQRGVIVVYVAFPGEMLSSLRELSNETIVLDNRIIKKAYKEAIK